MADAAAEEVASPTTLVLRYLQSKGIPPSSANVRAALEANARDPGVIPGLRSDTAATEADDQAAMRAAGKGGSRSSGGGRSTLPVDLGHGPTNEADWQPTTSSAPPAAQDVLAMQNATNPAMRAAVPDIPVAPATSTTPLPQIPKSPMQAALDDAVATRPQLPAPPPQITGPPAAPEAPMAPPNSAIPLPGPQAQPGLSIENVPMPPPQQTIQAPPASSIPPSGGLSIEDRMMPGRGNLTIQAPSASSIPPTTPPVVEETTPMLNRIVRGGATGAGVGRMFGPYGAAIGGVAGAAPGLWDLGRHIVGR